MDSGILSRMDTLCLRKRSSGMGTQGIAFLCDKKHCLSADIISSGQNHCSALSCLRREWTFDLLQGPVGELSNDNASGPGEGRARSAPCALLHASEEIGRLGKMGRFYRQDKLPKVPYPLTAEI